MGPGVKKTPGRKKNKAQLAKEAKELQEVQSGDPGVQASPITITEKSQSEVSSLDNIDKRKKFSTVVSSSSENMSKLQITFNQVKIDQLPKFTSNLEIYKQESIETFKNFKTQFSNVINKLAFASDEEATLAQILNAEITLSNRARNIILFILNDYLQGTAEIITKRARENQNIIETFNLLQSAWPFEEDNKRGSQIRDQLLNFKYIKGNSIQTHNQKYAALYNEALRLERVSNDTNAIDDYVRTLPPKNARNNEYQTNLHNKSSKEYL